MFNIIRNCQTFGSLSILKSFSGGSDAQSGLGAIEQLIDLIEKSSHWAAGK